MDFMDFENLIIEECSILLKRIKTEYEKKDAELKKLQIKVKEKENNGYFGWHEKQIAFERKISNHIKRDYLDTLAELEIKFGSWDIYVYLIIHRARMAADFDFDIESLDYDCDDTLAYDTYEFNLNNIEKLLPSTFYQWIVQNIHNIQSEIASLYIYNTNTEL